MVSNLQEVTPEVGGRYAALFGIHTFFVTVNDIFTLLPSGLIVADCTDLVTNKPLRLPLNFTNHAQFYRGTV